MEGGSPNDDTGRTETPGTQHLILSLMVALPMRAGVSCMVGGRSSQKKRPALCSPGRDRADLRTAVD